MKVLVEECSVDFQNFNTNLFDTELSCCLVVPIPFFVEMSNLSFFHSDSFGRVFQVVQTCYCKLLQSSLLFFIVINRSFSFHMHLINVPDTSDFDTLSSQSRSHTWSLVSIFNEGLRQTYVSPEGCAHPLQISGGARHSKCLTSSTEVYIWLRLCLFFGVNLGLSQNREKACSQRHTTYALMAIYISV